MNPLPTQIRRLENTGLSVVWSDAVQSTLTSKALRQNCPCAGCREARGEGNHDTPIAAVKENPSPNNSAARKPKPSSLRIVESELSEELSLQEVWAIGNYAIGLRWADGHSTGIYTYGLLRELSESTHSPREKSVGSLANQ